MIVDELTLSEIRMRLIHYFETSFGRIINRRILLVTLHCAGLEAWGECVAGEDPFYREESVDTAWLVIGKYLAPALVGKRLETARDCVELFKSIKGRRMAKAAIENALSEAEAATTKPPPRCPG